MLLSLFSQTAWFIKSSPKYLWSSFNFVNHWHRFVHMSSIHWVNQVVLLSPSFFFISVRYYLIASSSWCLVWKFPMKNILSLRESLTYACNVCNAHNAAEDFQSVRFDPTTCLKHAACSSRLTSMQFLFILLVPSKTKENKRGGTPEVPKFPGLFWTHDTTLLLTLVPRDSSSNARTPTMWAFKEKNCKWVPQWIFRGYDTSISLVGLV